MGNTAGSYSATGGGMTVRAGGSARGGTTVPYGERADLRASMEVARRGAANYAGIETGPATRRRVAQAKVAEATMVPEALTSLAPRSRPMSTWMFRENWPVPPWSWKLPTATVVPLATWSWQTIGPV